MISHFKVVGLMLLVLVALGGCHTEERKVERLGPPCGGLEGNKCSPDAYCRLRPGCGGIDKEGTCEFRPVECSFETQEVCGCDGKTYSNPCAAAMRGISIRDAGRCADTGGDS